MSAKPVNLNKHRKQKARVDECARADANAVKFGRTKAQKAREAMDAARASAHLDGSKREP